MVDIFKICLLLACISLLLVGQYGLAAAVASVCGLALLLFQPPAVERGKLIKNADVLRGGHKTDKNDN